MANWAKLQEQLTGLPVVKRAKHSIHFDKGNGEIVANFSGAPCHYEDKGVWKPIDTTLLLGADGFYGCPHSPVKVHKDGRVKVDKSNYSQFTDLPGSPIGKVDGNRIVRKFPGGRQYLYVTEDGFREEIVVDKPTFPLEKFIGKTSGTLPSAYKTSPQTAVDANGDVFEITSDTKAFGDWLEGAVYPVVIDPDFAGGTADGHILGQDASSYATARLTSTSATYGATDYVNIGQDAYGSGASVWRAYELFDTSSIGSGNVVTQVNLKLYVQVDKSVTDFDVQIVKYDWNEWAADQSNATKREAAYDGCLAGTADDSIWKNTADIVVSNAYTSGNLSTAWVNVTGTTYYGLRSSRDLNADTPTGDEFIQIGYAGHATVGRRPVLSVTYTAGSTGVPKHFLHYARLRSN